MGFLGVQKWFAATFAVYIYLYVYIQISYAALFYEH